MDFVSADKQINYIYKTHVLNCQFIATIRILPS